MGVERAVTRWYIQRQTLQGELNGLQTRLDLLQSQPETQEERIQLERQLVDAQQRLKALGPCPRPMMG